jgi:hypothetical protein
MHVYVMKITMVPFGCLYSKAWHCIGSNINILWYLHWDSMSIFVFGCLGIWYLELISWLNAKSCLGAQSDELHLYQSIWSLLTSIRHLGESFHPLNGWREGRRVTAHDGEVLGGGHVQIFLRTGDQRRTKDGQGRHVVGERGRATGTCHAGGPQHGSPEEEENGSREESSYLCYAAATAWSCLCSLGRSVEEREQSEYQTMSR